MKIVAASVCLLLVSGALTNHAAAQSWTSNGPLPRLLESMVYDTSTHRIIVFGGGSSDLTSSFPALNDVWRLYGSPNPLGGTGLNWNQVHAIGTPPAPRTGHAAGYDPASNRMIVFGGAVGPTTCANDVWVLTNANGFGGTAGPRHLVVAVDVEARVRKTWVKRKSHVFVRNLGKTNAKMCF